MKLVDLTVKGFADVLASNEPAPGGGSTAALEGALGACLAAMVCQLTLGKKKYEEHEALVKGALDRASSLKEDFLRVIDEDTESFNAVSAVFTMPKDTDEEKAARSAAMQSALQGSTKPPLKMMELSAQTLEMVSEIVGKSNASAASDLGVAALSLKAAIQGAWLNVLINLGGIKDEGFVSEYKSKGEALLSKALPLADEIYNTVLASL